LGGGVVQTKLNSVDNSDGVEEEWSAAGDRLIDLPAFTPTRI
jgi:hypothetical protein